MNRLRALALLALLLVGCGGAAPAGEVVSRQTMGEAWPLTVDSGTVECEPPGAVTFRAPNGTRYAVNGLATSRFPDMPEIDAIWADDPSGVAPKKNIGPLIDAGLALCD